MTDIRQGGNIHLATNTIFWHDGVDEEMLEVIQKGFHLMRNSPITLKLSSGGGDVNAGLAICDIMHTHKHRVTVEVWGRAESMAAVILQAADIRKISSSSHIMIHQGVEEPAADTKKNIKAYLKLSDNMDDICDSLVLRRIQKKFPKYSWNQFRQETHFDIYFKAQEALKWNLVDKII